MPDPGDIPPRVRHFVNDRRAVMRVAWWVICPDPAIANMWFRRQWIREKIGVHLWRYRGELFWREHPRWQYPGPCLALRARHR
jgi:hypothetical protein